MPFRFKSIGMPQFKEIYCIRHGQTEFNALGIVQGSGVDTDLNDKGRAQAQAFYNFYQHIDFDVVLVSTLKRTYQTVEQFIQKGIPHERFAHIDECSWGIHEGQPSSPEMHAKYKWLAEEWTTGDLNARLEGGESALDLKKRLIPFLELLRDRPERKILMCAHGRIIRAFISLIKTGDVRHMEYIPHRNTGLYKIVYDLDAFSVILENDARHLPHE
jgi:probable phosphoglycerate mutase